MADPVVLSFAFFAGIVAAFNPCAFVVLPAFLSNYLLKHEGEQEIKEKFSKKLFKGLGVGGRIVLGFMLIFLILGLIIAFFSSAFANLVPYLNLFLGVALIIVAILLLVNKMPSINIPIRLPVKASSHGEPSFFHYGMIYGFTSFGCTLPIFLAVVVGAVIERGILDGFLTFLAYSLGMGSIVMAITLGIALAKHAFVKKLIRLVPYQTRITAVVLLIVGAYVIYRTQTLYFA